LKSLQLFQKFLAFVSGDGAGSSGIESLANVIDTNDLILIIIIVVKQVHIPIWCPLYVIDNSRTSCRYAGIHKSDL